MITDAEAAVQNGIALFLGGDVIDWASRIDFDKVNMWVGSDCIAGQVFAEKAREAIASGDEPWDCSCCEFNGYDYASRLIYGTTGRNGLFSTSDYGFCPSSFFSEKELVNAWKAAVAATL